MKHIKPYPKVWSNQNKRDIRNYYEWLPLWKDFIIFLDYGVDWQVIVAVYREGYTDKERNLDEGFD